MRILACIVIISVSISSRAEVIDSHFHFVSPENQPHIRIFEEPVGAAFAIEELNQAGADRAVALSAAYFLNEEAAAKHENDYVRAEADKFPDRIIPFCSVNIPAEWALREIKRCKDVLRLRGLKLHLTTNGMSLLNPDHLRRVDEVFDQAEHSKLPVLVDFNKWDTSEFFELLRLMVSHPDTDFIVAHSLFTNYRDLGLLAAIYKESPSIRRNVYLDVSATINFYSGSPEQDMFFWYLRQYGLEYVFFGSDYPVYSTKQALDALSMYPMSQLEFDALAGRNFSRFISQDQYGGSLDPHLVQEEHLGISNRDPLNLLTGPSQLLGHR